MSIIKETIRYNNQSLNLKIKLSSNDAFNGYQQEIDNLTTFTTNSLINPVTDIEMRRFKHYTDINTTIRFQFYNGISYNTLFSFAGFTNEEILGKSLNTQNSFFILDYYDSFDYYTQNKIFTTYLTKIANSGTTTSTYLINPTSNNQFYRWYVPISYIESQTGTTVIGYVKFSFYNAKTGKIQIFYNLNNESLVTAEKMYFKTNLNLQNNTWQIISSTFPTITAKEYMYNTNKLYTDRINDTFDNFENLKQDYPSGNTFNIVDGTYLTT
jgi:hypothetical protein